MPLDMQPKKQDQGKTFTKNGVSCCDGCPTKGKPCDTCLFARWNVDALKILGDPSAKLKDANNSPMMQKMAQSPKLNPPFETGLKRPNFGKLVVPSFNRVMQLKEMF